MSSAEAEAAAVVNATLEAVAVSRWCAEFQTSLDTCIYIDTAVAIKILEIEGVGNIRYIDVGVLWMQQKYISKIFRFGKKQMGMLIQPTS